ncbi:MAG: hypothetical protein A2X58_01430 [Nitrospirae bacterium GWC2_56_14]|nr:MAG: hypothetical protein A2X58_01430 [Nitrospirae bacterium GWC2_56_14]
MEQLKRALWLPLSISKEKAEVIACYPGDPGVVEDIRSTLGVDDVAFKGALPSDLIRIIEHNQDLNPGFPPAAGRTPLAKVRTFLANARSQYACYRTSLAKGRTGLAFLRTGIAFVTTALLLFRVFGMGYLTIPEALLFAAGIVMAIDGLRWYLPARATGKSLPDCISSEPTNGTSVLAANFKGESPEFHRTAEVPNADTLRQGWNRLSPVMRRRFLASDRTDLAEERTALACYRTLMARARTGLSFTRTGIAFIGLGVALIRQLPAGPWSIVDALFILAGAAMVAEGFFWYVPGRSAGAKSSLSVKRSEEKPRIWDFVFPPAFALSAVTQRQQVLPLVKGFSEPGIWATTGLALERTLLAERRNVMARLRTIMARSRTGMAIIRTGMSISAVGLGLLVYFGAASMLWTLFDLALLGTGLLLIADGAYWYLPAERARQQLPYCYGEMEIAIPDYGVPARSWGKAVFNHDDL